MSRVIVANRCRWVADVDEHNFPALRAPSKAANRPIARMSCRSKGSVGAHPVSTSARLSTCHLPHQLGAGEPLMPNGFHACTYLRCARPTGSSTNVSGRVTGRRIPSLRVSLWSTAADVFLADVATKGRDPRQHYMLTNLVVQLTCSCAQTDAECEFDRAAEPNGRETGAGVLEAVRDWARNWGRSIHHVDLQLAQRNCLVTGGTKGIGKATALMMADEGCRVAIVARSKSDLERSPATSKRQGSTVRSSSRMT